SGGCLCRVVDPIAKGALIDISAGAMIGSPGSGLDARPNQSTQIPPRQSGKLSQHQNILMALGGERSMNKIYPDASAALAGLLRDGMTIMSGGFGLCGIPERFVAAIRDSAVTGLTMISNNAGIDGAGLGLLLETRQIRKMISSYVGENQLFADLYLKGEL